MPSTELTLVTDADIDKSLASSNLVVESVQSLKTAFQPHFSAFSKLAIAAQAIPKDAPKAARAMRLEMRSIRLAAEKTRKELNEDSAARTKAVNGLNHLLLYALSPIEKYLQEVEDAEEIAEAARLAAQRSARNQEMSKYGELPTYDLGPLPQAQYDMLLLGAKTAYEAKLKAEADRIEAEKKAAEDRAKKEAADAAERERLRVENERLAQIAAEERNAREAAEKQAAAEKAAREAAEKARIAKEEAEKKRLADEAAVKQRSVEEAARKEREAAQKQREALEAEIKRREQEEATKKAAEAARIEAEKVAARAAQEKALAAPDKEKLLAFARTISTLAVPVLTSKPGVVFSPKLTTQVAKFAAWVESEANKL